MGGCKEMAHGLAGERRLMAQSAGARERGDGPAQGHGPRTARASEAEGGRPRPKEARRTGRLMGHENGVGGCGSRASAAMARWQEGRKGRWRRLAERRSTAANTKPRRHGADVGAPGERGRGGGTAWCGAAFLAVAAKDAAVLRGWYRDGDRSQGRRRQRLRRWGTMQEEERGALGVAL